MEETTTLNKKEEINTPTPSDTLYIRKYLSRKGKIYYGTFLNGTFYFVHIKDGTELERHETKKDKKQAVGRVGKVFRERRNYQYDSTGLISRFSRLTVY